VNIFDANIILRYILQDNREMADKVELWIQQAKYFIPIEVIAEVVYVLHKVYRVDRCKIERELTITINEKNAVIPHREVVFEALQIYVQTKLDFVDCLLIGYAKIEGHHIITFDKKLNQLLKTTITINCNSEVL
jgi:predicted nucleic-acid-binding protein